MSMRLIASAVLVAGISAGIGYGVYQTQRAGARVDTSDAPVAEIRTLPDFTLPDTDGKPRSQHEWVGKVLVLNFWATWCPPCRKETPTFVELQKEYDGRNVQFVGIAIDDLEPVKQFAEEFAVNYPLLIGGTEAVEMSRKLGNRLSGLPFSVVFDQRGQVYATRVGEFTREQLEQVFVDLL